MPAGEQVGAIVERIGTVAGAHQMLGIGRDLPATDEATAAGIEAGTRFTRARSGFRHVTILARILHAITAGASLDTVPSPPAPQRGGRQVPSVAPEREMQARATGPVGRPRRHRSKWWQRRPVVVRSVQVPSKANQAVDSSHRDSIRDASSSWSRPIAPLKSSGSALRLSTAQLPATSALASVSASESMAARRSSGRCSSGAP